MSRSKRSVNAENHQSSTNPPSSAVAKKNDSPRVILKPHPEVNPLDRIAAEFLPGQAPLAQRRTIVRTEESFDGPFPHPDILRKYGEIVPDAPERILRVFEEDSKHVRDIQFAALNAQKGDNYRVHWMAYSLIVGGYAMSALFAWMSKDVLAGIVLTTTIIGTVAGFLQHSKEASHSEAVSKDEVTKGD